MGQEDHALRRAGGKIGYSSYKKPAISQEMAGFLYDE
jgi:hypothetical protein